MRVGTSETKKPPTRLRGRGSFNGSGRGVRPSPISTAGCARLSAASCSGYQGICALVRALVERHVAELRRLSRRRRTKPGEDVLGELLRLGCVTERSDSYVVDVEPSMWERAADAVVDATRSLWRGSQPAPPSIRISDPYGLGLSTLATASPTQAARSNETGARPQYVPHWRRRRGSMVVSSSRSTPFHPCADTR